MASVRDGRLGRQLTLMKKLELAILLLEGRPQWTNDGLLIGSTNWTVAQHHGILWSVQSRGIWLATAETLGGTIDWLLLFQKWCQKERRLSSLETRPKGKDEWGKRIEAGRDFAIFLLQSFPGIGAGVAGNIYDHFGYLPMTWRVTEEELAEVPGVGKGRAKTLWSLLNKSQSVAASSPTSTKPAKKSSRNGASVKKGTGPSPITDDSFIDMTR